jgi:serine/threonine protein kinase
MLEKIGKYEVIRSLGKGATAVVYLARDPDLDRLVAIKLIRFGEDNAAMSRRLRKLFQTEDSIGRRLDHPNIVKIYDAVVEPERLIWRWSLLTAQRSTSSAPSIVCCRCTG